MKKEVLTIPEYHFECEFCVIEMGKAYCSGRNNKMIELEDPENEIDLNNCPIWGKINERKRTN